MNSNKDVSYFKKLFGLYRDNQCSPAQVKELFKYINENEYNREILNQLHDDFEHEFENDSKPFRLNKVESEKEVAKVIPLYKSTWRRLAIAAAGIIFIAAGAYFLFNMKPDEALVAKNSIEKEDITPGGNRAILTLGNGKQIILDSTLQGTIALQGNATITKNNEGQIVYDASKGNAGAEILYNTVSTPVGGIFKVVLPDGSNVWLNAGSSVYFPTSFTGNERKVTITGEAYFEIAKNEAQPFKISVNNKEEIQVIGTHFNVMSYENEPDTRITLLEGAIRISKENKKIVLKPGQQAISGKGYIQKTNELNTIHEVEWTNGLFDFQDDNLPYIMRQLSRWYNIDVVYSGNVPQGHYVGSIRKQSGIREVLKMLELAGDVSFSIVGKQIVVKEN